MGMIRQAAGDRRRAEECFHKTIYLDPRHDKALLALALLAERRGDRDAAAGFRRRAAARHGRPTRVRRRRATTMIRTLLTPDAGTANGLAYPTTATAAGIASASPATGAAPS